MLKHTSLLFRFVVIGTLTSALPTYLQAQTETEKEQVMNVEVQEGTLMPPEEESAVGDQEKVYEFVDVSAEFPGGMTAMMKHIRDSIVYPQEAVEKGIQGKVYVSFVVRTDGSIDNIHIDRSPDGMLSTEAIRVVKTFPKFAPARLDGAFVASRYRLPVSFQLTK